MTGATIGSVVRIYYDSPRSIQVGDGLRTSTGRMYLITNIRTQLRGLHRGRKYLECLVVKPESEIPGIVHPLYWYKRQRKRPLLYY